MAENKKILLKSSAGDNLYPRASLDNLVDVVGGTTAVQVPTLDSDGRIESRFLPTGMSLLDSDGRIDSRYLPPDFFPPAARVTLSGTVYVSSGALLRDAEETSGFIRVLSGGSAKRITVTSGNFTVSSGGAATDMNWNSPGIMYIPGGHVQYVDCRKGSIEVQKGGHLEHVTASTGCLLFVSSGGTATSIVEYGGYVRVPTGAVGQFEQTVIPNLALSASQSATVHSGNAVSNATISSGGSLHVFEGGQLTGQCSVLNGGSMVLYNGAVLDFRIADMSPGDTARFNDTSKISRSNNAVVSYTLTVSEDQPSGVYALGGNCSSWNTELLVRTDDGVSLGTLALNGSLAANGMVFSLSIIDNELSVTVSRSNQ
jgi:hypothetical protein